MGQPDHPKSGCQGSQSARMIGGYIAIYEAQTTMPELKESKRQGGSVVTSLCVFGFEQHMLDSVLAVKMHPDRPYEAMPCIARSIREIIQCAGSKYTFVNYGKLPLQLGGKSALVGLPCQLPRARKEYVKIGLFCGLNVTERRLDYLLKWSGIPKEEIAYLDWRSPKNKLLEIRLRSGQVHYLDHWPVSFFFPRRPCLRCTDYSSHHADIAVGDRTADTSAVIVRSKLGQHLFTQAVKDGYITATEISLKSFIERRMSPMLQKELRGGFVNVPFVRCYGPWVDMVPPAILRYVGRKLASRLKRLTEAERTILEESGTEQRKVL